MALNELSNDADEFIWGRRYDDVIINKCCQLYYEEQNDPVKAMAYDSKATRTLARRKEDQERSAEDMIATVANPHDVLLPRVRADEGSITAATAAGAMVIDKPLQTTNYQCTQNMKS